MTAAPHLVVVSNVHNVSDGRVLHRQAAFAARAGFRVSVYAIDDGESPAGITTHGFPRPRSRFQRFLLGLRMAWRAWRERADIYHFHDPELLPAMTLLRLVTRRPVIYDCHENVVDSVYYKSYIPRPLRPMVAGCTYLLQWLCVRLLGHAVLATPEQCEMLPAPTTTLVVRNFPPLSTQRFFDPRSDRPFALVHCGGFSIERGSRIMLEMLRILVHELGCRDARLLLVGVGPGDLDHESARRLRDDRLEAHVELRGRVPLSQVPAELARAKIGLMCHQPSKQYRYGVASKVFDYMAAGLAIIGGNADFDRPFVPEGDVKIYVDETNPAQYALAALELLRDDERRVRMGIHARELFETFYTAEQQSQGLIDFYHQALRARAA